MIKAKGIKMRTNITKTKKITASIILAIYMIISVFGGGYAAFAKDISQDEAPTATIKDDVVTVSGVAESRL